MTRIRVLIVEGSSITRQLLHRLLDRDLELEVVGAIASGRMALAKLGELRPDLVLLDVDLPDLEGLRTLAGLRETHPTLPVIMFSRLTERGSRTTVDALLLGASDYVTKPGSSADLERCVQGELTAKIKTLGAARPPERPAGPPAAQSANAAVLKDRPVAGSPPSHAAEIVVIATSTGGPNALASLLSSLPQSFATPIVVVQHMASGFTAALAESLRRQTGRNVCEAGTAQPLDAATVWLAPGGRHLAVTRQGVTVHVVPNDDPPENGCRPSADVLFRSAVDVFGARCLAVVLTGMGYDGLAGCRVIRQAGGSILVQDQASSVAWGMPGQVAAAGLADEVLPLTDFPHEICRRTDSARARRA